MDLALKASSMIPHTDRLCIIDMVSGYLDPFESLTKNKLRPQNVELCPGLKADFLNSQHDHRIRCR